jgi:hypothetical protein
MSIVRLIIMNTLILFVVGGDCGIPASLGAESGFPKSRALEGIAAPLGSEGVASIDPALVGRWTCMRKDDEGVTKVKLLALKFSAHAYYGAFTPVSMDKNSVSGSLLDKLIGPILHFRMFISRVDDHRFINFQGIGLNDDRSYTFCEYEINDNGDLILREVNRDIFAANIRSIEEARRAVSRNLKLGDGNLYKPTPMKCSKVR